MGEEEIILRFCCMGVKTEGGTAALYHIITKSAMGEEEIILRFCRMGVKTEGGTAALYHIITKSAMGEEVSPMDS